MGNMALTTHRRDREEDNDSFDADDDEAILEAYEHCTQFSPPNNQTNWVDFADLMSRHKFRKEYNIEEIKQRAIYLARGKDTKKQHAEQNAITLDDGAREDNLDDDDDDADVMSAETVSISEYSPTFERNPAVTETEASASASASSKASSNHGNKINHKKKVEEEEEEEDVKADQLTDIEREVAWLGEEGMTLSNRPRFDWAHIEAHASPALKATIEAKKKTAPRYDHAKLCCLVRQTRQIKDAFWAERMKNRAILAARKKELETEEENEQTGERKCANEPISVESINRKYKDDFTEAEIEIAWIGEEERWKNFTRQFDWDYIEQHASPSLAAYMRRVKDTKSICSRTSNKLNFFLRRTKAKKRAFDNLLDDIRTFLASREEQEGSERTTPSAQPNTRVKEGKASTLAVETPAVISNKNPKKRGIGKTSLLPSPAKRARRTSSTPSKKERGFLKHTNLRETDIVPTPEKSKQLRKHMRQVHRKGDVVYACWIDGDNNSWYPATITGSKVIRTTPFGQERIYSVQFDDGDYDPRLMEIFVMSRDDYIFSLRHARDTFQGIRQYTVSTLDDEYAECRGWFETEHTDDTVFASLSDAVRARDDAIVAIKGGRTLKKDLNAPEEWEFAHPFGRRPPLRTHGFRTGASGEATTTDSMESIEHFQAAMQDTETNETKVGLNKQQKRAKPQVAIEMGNGIVNSDDIAEIDILMEELSKQEKAYKLELKEYDATRKEAWTAYEKRRREQWKAYENKCREEWKAYEQEEQASRKQYLERYSLYVSKIKQVGNRIKEIYGCGTGASIGTS